MTTANPLTPKMIAALLVIGDKILSGRTKDKNIGYIAEYLTALGIDLKEVRVVGDEETAIVDALNALRHRYTYVFTTGGIGPAPDDITSGCVAKAFGVPIDVDPRALAILHDWLKATGAEMSEARMRMTRIPKAADLVLARSPRPIPGWQSAAIRSSIRSMVPIPTWCCAPGTHKSSSAPGVP
jgi:molybdenum cofactor synthesis domain-containing protein